MIRGVYLNTMNDDLSKCMKIYQDVFEEDMNENVETWKNSNSEDMAIYLLLYNENEIPVGTARLILMVFSNLMDWLCFLSSERMVTAISLCI